jgi:hypothetical protein
VPWKIANGAEDLNLWALHFQQTEPPTVKVKVKVILRPTVSRPVCLGVKHPSGTRDQFSPSFLQLFLDIYRFVDVGRPLDEKSGL